MALQTKKIFIDSSVFVAFVDRSNKNHPKAVKSMEHLARERYFLYTSIQNIQDTYAILAKEIGVSMALEFLQATLESNMEIIFPQKTDLITAHKVLKANRDRQMILKETLNATLMQKRRVQQILTFTYWHNLFGTYVSNLAS